MKYYLQALTRYAVFEGRASRTEFWMYFLFQIIVGFVCMFLDMMFETTFGSEVYGLIYIAYCLATLLPTLAVKVRRFHDTNKSGWMVLLVLIPYVGFIIVLILLALEGTKGDNQYGPEPVDN